MYSVQFQEKLIFEIFLIEKFCFKILMDFEMAFGDHFLNSKIGKKIIMGYSFPWETISLISLVSVLLRD